MDEKQLRKILKNHNEWLFSGYERGEKADLHGADLCDANLHGANLRDADLLDANLRGANLRDADLRGANLRDADLRDANLRYANLRYANLHGADLHGADLRSADLRYADLRDADLRGTNLDYALLPMWCGGLNVHLDDRLARQLLYHLLKNVGFSKNTSTEMKRLLLTPELVEEANRFHRVGECGEIAPYADDDV